jgi:predicted ATP-grasp superfamily ATP-dependent carboligase
MSTVVRLRRSQSGLVGKMIVIWLLLVAVIGVATIDTVSIAFTKFRTQDIASNAASTAANTWRDTENELKACDAARVRVAAEDHGALITKNGCVVNEATGEVTITVRKEAATLLAGRLPWTKKLAKPEAVETSGPTVL